MSSAIRPPSGPRNPAPRAKERPNAITPRTIQFWLQDQSRFTIIPIAARKRISEAGMKTRIPTTSVSFAKSACRLPSPVRRMRKA
jgi:hypothetical protein